MHHNFYSKNIGNVVDDLATNQVSFLYCVFPTNS